MTQWNREVLKMLVYAPEGVTLTGLLEPVPLPAPGPGMRIGTLDNNKPNAGLLLTALAAQLSSRMGSTEPLNTEKERASLPAPQEVIDRLVADADYVLVGSAD